MLNNKNRKLITLLPQPDTEWQLSNIKAAYHVNICISEIFLSIGFLNREIIETSAFPSLLATCKERKKNQHLIS